MTDDGVEGGAVGPADIISRMRGGDINWSAPNADQLAWREWDGFYVVFNPASTEMHLLDPLGRELVDIIAEKPRSNDELFAEMEKLFERKLEFGLREKIINSLAELDNIGLIEPHLASVPAS
jgi:PqqD family protein of HPr-rel-A system